MTRIWTSFDTLAIALLVLLLGTLVAEAQGFSCTRVGNSTFCSGAAGSVTCTRVGNSTFCN